MPEPLIDIDTDPRYGLEGTIVTMDDYYTVIPHGVVYINGDTIVAVQPASSPTPTGYEDIPIVKTEGTIFPGLIELHNHLSYNILPLWDVPRQFTNRGQWARHPAKRKWITAPMHVLGRTEGYIEAIVRYVECKCLIAGVTTSQGISLFSSKRIEKCYRGVVRNVERPEHPMLPKAGTKIPDVDAKDAEKFLKQLENSTCKLLHLSEGIDVRSRNHFLALQISEDKWAITDALAGIHSTALTADDFQVLAKYGASTIWSPLSNLLLYNETADIQFAKDHGLLIGLGSDWSPSGSKNLLCELKVAKIFSARNGGIFSDVEIVAMATRNAAKILKWDSVLGSIESGKLADLIVLKGTESDPYAQLICAIETSISLVIIDGVPRCGDKQLMHRFGYEDEEIHIGDEARILNLQSNYDNPIQVTLSLHDARNTLQHGLSDLKTLAENIEARDTAFAMGMVDAAAEPIWVLALEQDEIEDAQIRPTLFFEGEATGFETPFEAVDYIAVLSDVQITLDPLSIVDDDEYFENLAYQMNLPDYIKTDLPPYYNVEPFLPDSAKFLKDAHPEVRHHFASTIELSTFLDRVSRIIEFSVEDRKRIIEQALILFENVYVHLPLKQAMHAIDPIQKLKLMQYQLEKQPEELLPELEFHKEMIRIFTSTRDLHTNYLLPSPFREKVAFLPFLIEEYIDTGLPKRKRYIVSKVMQGFTHQTFKEGVEVLYWNGVPIHRAIEVNAERQAGSNPDARFVRGLDTLTIRPMIRVLPPDEEWVAVRYKTLAEEVADIEHKWLVTSLPELPTLLSDSDDAGRRMANTTAVGLDIQTDAIQQMKKILFVPQALVSERETMVKQAAIGSSMYADEPLATSLPLKANKVPPEYGNFGYLRVYSFNVSSDEEFLDDIRRIVANLPADGLIIDVRGNGGGLIYAAERLLQLFTPREIKPEPAQFVNTRLNYDLCALNSPSRHFEDFTLETWKESIQEAVRTGATYSRGFPITPPEACNDQGQSYYGPVLLITDALCYSATDMFTAGFKDHQIGTILGIHNNTGAGGANVWTHRLLQRLMSDPDAPDSPLPESPFKPLPYEAEMRVSIRRTMRVNDYSGIPLEDLGVKPDVLYSMTQDDLQHGNRDLIAKAAEILAAMPKYQFDVDVRHLQDTRYRVTIQTQNITRIDFYLNKRPLFSKDVTDSIEHEMDMLPGQVLEVHGYKDDKLVASFRKRIAS
ncbi:MAG: S41 family peptidase [Candidatus Hermodarchaeia archaeon]|jgi:cytosine/adenosine deaminase-related metal-dependent hydrolase